MGRTNTTHINWKRQNNGTYTAGPHKTAGYQATIAYAAPNYTLTVTGSGAPAPQAYATRKLAKHAYQLFLHTKS